MSYAIQQTYEIDHDRETNHGIQEHERQHLPSRIEKFKQSKSLKHALRDIDYPKRQENAHLFFKEIFNSKLIFSGHGSKHRRNFFGKKRNLVGCPDYIFKKENGQEIVVEEKFSIKPIPDDFHGYDNHKIQILSYLFALNNIKASHGYLIYWFRKRKEQDTKDNFPLDYHILKVEKTMEGKENLIKAFNKVTTLNKAKLYSFSRNQINAKKCVNCSVSLYCKHKTGRYSSFSLPYDQE